ncbi:MAG: hypothetical protein AAFP02_23670 [Bacteroidota bacterium]
MRNSLIAFCLCLCLMLACGEKVPQQETPPAEPVEKVAENLDLSALPTKAARLAIPLRAEEAIQAIKSKNLRSLAKLVHPEMGLRFSPQVSVETNHKVFKAKELRELFRDSTTYEWGVQDASGEPINSTFNAYYQRYLYDVDFAVTDSVYYNQPQQHGNAINNVAKAYPGCVVVEYYIPGVEESMMGMDWRALRLVFEPYEDDWYLVGIVHAAWTS